MLENRWHDLSWKHSVSSHLSLNHSAHMELIKSWSPKREVSQLIQAATRPWPAKDCLLPIRPILFPPKTNAQKRVYKINGSDSVLQLSKGFRCMPAGRSHPIFQIYKIIVCFINSVQSRLVYLFLCAFLMLWFQCNILSTKETSAAQSLASLFPSD